MYTIINDIDHHLGILFITLAFIYLLFLTITTHKVRTVVDFIDIL